MTPTQTYYLDASKLSSIDQRKQAQYVGGVLLIMVVMAHLALALYLLTPSNTEQKKPEIMDVVLIEQPKAVKPEPVAQPTPPQPKVEPVKPKPIVKPIVNKPAVKPIPQTKISEPKVNAPDPIVAPAPSIAQPEPILASANPSNNVSANNSANNVKANIQESKTVVTGIVPLVRVPPKYPARAATRHIEGWVKIEFTIQIDGSVDTPIVVSAEPEGIFDDAALTAISKWKFKEKQINGVAVTQRAMQTLQFKLE